MMFRVSFINFVSCFIFDIRSRATVFYGKKSKVDYVPKKVAGHFGKLAGDYLKI